MKCHWQQIQPGNTQIHLFALMEGNKLLGKRKLNPNMKGPGSATLVNALTIQQALT